MSRKVQFGFVTEETPQNNLTNTVELRKEQGCRGKQ